MTHEHGAWRGFTITDARPFGYVVQAPGMRPRWRWSGRSAIALGLRMQTGRRPR